MNNRPRLLYILHNYHNRGGVEGHCKLLARALADRYDIWIIAPGPAAPSGVLIELIHDGKVHDALPAGPLAWPVTPLEEPNYDAALAKFLEKTRPDIIHVQHLFNWPLGTLKIVLDSNVPVLLSMHDYYFITPWFTMEGAREPIETLTPEYSLKRYGADITPYLEKRHEYLGTLLPRLRRIVVPSPFLAAVMRRGFDLDYAVIEHGIEPWDLLPRTSSKTLRFLYFGSLIPQKGWTVPIDAFRLLNEKFSETELNIWGSGDRVDLSPFCGLSGVAFHGAFNPDQLPEILARNDVAIIPSLFAETYSLTLSEAWFAGLPVIASAIGALTERVQPGINGELFTPGDVEALCGAMRWFVKNDGWRGWKIPAPRLAEPMVRDYHALYGELLGS